MKKFFALVFAALMLVCCFAACDKPASSVASVEPSSVAASSEESSVSSVEASSEAASSEESSVAASSEVSSAAASSKATSSKEEAPKTYIDTIKEKGVITMYTNAYFPPMEYYDGTEIKGVDVEIAAKIAEKLGVTLEVKDADFNSLCEAVNAGKADFAAAGMSVKPEREEIVDFTNTYVTTCQYVIVLENDDITTNFNSLAGAIVGVQEATTGNLYVEDEINGGCLKDTEASVKLYANALLAVQDLKNHKVDVVVIDELTAKNIVASQEGLKCFELKYADGTTTIEHYAIAVSKANPELLKVINEVIDDLKADGSIDKWIVSHTLNAAA